MAHEAPTTKEDTILESLRAAWDSESKNLNLLLEIFKKQLTVYYDIPQRRTTRLYPGH